MQWFTDITGLVTIVVIAENTVTGREYHTVVGANDNETYIAICNPTDSFSVIVVAFDQCQNFSSDSTIVHEQSSKTSLEPTVTSPVISTSYPSSSLYHFPIETMNCTSKGIYNNK